MALQHGRGPRHHRCWARRNRSSARPLSTGSRRHRPLPRPVDTHAAGRCCGPAPPRPLAAVPGRAQGARSRGGATEAGICSGEHLRFGNQRRSDATRAGAPRGPTRPPPRPRKAHRGLEAHAPPANSGQSPTATRTGATRPFLGRREQPIPDDRTRHPIAAPQVPSAWGTHAATRSPNRKRRQP